MARTASKPKPKPKPANRAEELVNGACPPRAQRNPPRIPLRDGKLVHATYLDPAKITPDPHCTNPKE